MGYYLIDDAQVRSLAIFMPVERFGDRMLNKIQEDNLPVVGALGNVPLLSGDTFMQHAAYWQSEYHLMKERVEELEMELEELQNE